MTWIGITVGSVVVVAALFFMLRFIASLQQQIGQLTQLIQERLRETTQSLQETHRTVGERLDSATRVFGDVQRSLGRLEETHKQIYEVGRDISTLQELLRAPKFRGEVGETLLTRLLEDILPHDHIRIQHRFKSGDIVDAAIEIGERLICVDAKFPLENFKRAGLHASGEEHKQYYRVFVRDVKNRVDEVSSKYIVPDEGTFDFALMYIPAEAVFYHISKDAELSGYAHAKKVIFVSPNTFYAYVQAILYGLKGVKIERNIHKIFSELSRLQIDLGKFQDDFELIGTHISNATKKYTEARVKLDSFAERLDSGIEMNLSESDGRKES